MTTLQAYANDLKTAVEFLPKNYNDMTIEELAEGYCDATDAGDELSRDAYFAGLSLKFWYLIDKLYKENGSALKLERADFIGWINGSIEQACTERAWRSNPKLKVQAIIQQIIATRYKAGAYYESNLLIHKANFGTESLDKIIDEDNETSLLDSVASKELTPLESYNAADKLIQKCLDDNKVIEAIITQTIAYNDCEKHENKIVKETKDDGTIHKYINATSQFWPYQVVKLLSSLTDDYKRAFKENYKVDAKILDVVFKKIKDSNNTKLYEYLDNTKEYLRTQV